MFKVRSKYLLLIAAAVWLIAGSQVARMGIEAIAAGQGNLWLLLLGIPATFLEAGGQACRPHPQLRGGEDACAEVL